MIEWFEALRAWWRRVVQPDPMTPLEDIQSMSDTAVLESLKYNIHPLATASTDGGHDQVQFQVYGEPARPLTSQEWRLFERELHSFVDPHMRAECFKNPYSACTMWDAEGVERTYPS